jgi:hypothetical protein
MDTVLPFVESYPTVLRPLLAGLESAVRDKKTLVLVEDDPAVASCWFAALQYFLPAAAAWSLPFNTWRRAADLLRRPAAGAYLVAVPSDDASAVEALAATGAIVVSAAQPPSEETAGDGPISWRLSRSTLVAGTWARLAFDVLRLDPWSRNGVWVAMDELADSAEAGGRTAPLWFLAASVLKGAPDVGLRDSTALLAEQWPTAEAVPPELASPLIERAAAAVEDRYRFLQAIATRLAGSDAAGNEESGAKGRRQATQGTALIDRVAVGLLKEAMTDAVTPEMLSWPPTLVGSESAMIKLLDEVPALLAWTREAPRGTVSAARAAIMAGWVIDGTWPSYEQARLATEEAAYRHLLPLLIADDGRPEKLCRLGFVDLPESLWRNGVARFLRVILGPSTASVPEEFAELAEAIRSRWAVVQSARVHPAVRQWLQRRIDHLLLDTPAHRRPLPTPRPSAWDDATGAASKPTPTMKPAKTIAPVHQTEPGQESKPVHEIEPVYRAEPMIAASADPTPGPSAPAASAPANFESADTWSVSRRVSSERSSHDRPSFEPAVQVPATFPAEIQSGDVSLSRFSRYASLLQEAPRNRPAGWAAYHAAALWRNEPAELADLAERILVITPSALHDLQLLDLLLGETCLGDGRRLIDAYRGGPGINLVLELHNQFAGQSLFDAIRGRHATNELTRRIEEVKRMAQGVGLPRQTRFIESCEQRLAALILLMDPAADSMGRDLSSSDTIAGLRLDVTFYSLPFDEVWAQLSKNFQARVPLPSPRIDYQKVLAVLFVRSILQSADDPALQWFQGSPEMEALPFSSRLVDVLSWSPSHDNFREQIHLEAIALTSITEVAVSTQRHNFIVSCREKGSKLVEEARALFEQRR